MEWPRPPSASDVHINYLQGTTFALHHIMASFSEHDDLKYQALAKAALAAASGESTEAVARAGLDAAVEYMQLSGGALILWNSRREVTTKAISAAEGADRRLIDESETTLLSMLRRQFKVSRAYLELGEAQIRSLFSLPIELGGYQFGALIGIKRGSAPLHEHDSFLRSLAAVLSLAMAPRDTGPAEAPDVEEKIKAERREAIVELAVAINHEINNPLTALMGNLQLLALKNKELPDDIKNRLKVIEESANKIREVTARLMRAAEKPSVAYNGDIKMVDLSGRDETEQGGEDDASDEEKANE